MKDAGNMARKRRCFVCNGIGQMCNICGEAEGVCACEDEQDLIDCPDCEGSGIASADRSSNETQPTDSWFVKKLIAMEACGEAIKYARKYRTFPAAWNECIRRNWTVWLVEQLHLYSVPNIGTAKHKNCLACYGTVDTIRRRFPAARVSAALRKVKV